MSETQEASTQPEAQTTWTSRIVGLEYHKPRELLDHPKQWKQHPESQLVGIRAVLDQIGIADALLAWRSERAGGALVTFDGHGRKSLDPDAEWPVLVTDLTDEEADEMLLVLDPLASRAAVHKEKLRRLLDDVKRTASGRTRRLLGSIAKRECAKPRERKTPVPAKKMLKCPSCGHEWHGTK